MTVDYWFYHMTVMLSVLQSLIIRPTINRIQPTAPDGPRGYKSGSIDCPARTYDMTDMAVTRVSCFTSI